MFVYIGAENTILAERADSIVIPASQPRITMVGWMEERGCESALDAILWSPEDRFCPLKKLLSKCHGDDLDGNIEFTHLFYSYHHSPEFEASSAKASSLPSS